MEDEVRIRGIVINVVLLVLLVGAGIYLYVNAEKFVGIVMDIATTEVYDKIFLD